MPKSHSISTPFLRTAQRMAETSKAAKTAITRTRSTLARRLIPETTRDISAEYALPQARIRAGLSVEQTPEGVRLIAAGRGVGLINYGARQVREGVTVTVLRGTGRGLLAGSFIANARGGGKQVFDRKIVGGKRAGRLPLERRYGPSVAQQLRKGDREDRLGNFAQQLAATELDRQLALTRTG